MMRKTIVLLSGGMDSATTLASAKNIGFACYALSVDYGQRHSAELTAAKKIADTIGVVEHRTLHVDLGQLGGSALTDTSVAVPQIFSDGIPITYVPARNIILLGLALAWAEVLKADVISMGINAIDYSGYPDCRPEFIAAFEALAVVGTKSGTEGSKLRIYAPLLGLTKAAIIRCGLSLGLDYSMTVSCYQADVAGRACGKCDACRLRRQGFAEAKIADPTCYMT